MSSKYEKGYFAAKEDPQDVVNILKKRMDYWYKSLYVNGYLEKVKRSWAAYHNASYDSLGGDHKITFGGEQGELVSLSVNHFRNIGQHLLILTTSSRPSVNTRASNNDYKSMTQTILANGLIDYYMREKKLEEYLRTAAEYAIALGEGYVKVEWDQTAGEVVDYNEDTHTEIREGDVRFSNLSPFDVIRDSYREDNDADWYICRSYKNRYDLIAEYPNLEEPLLDVEAKSQYQLKFGSVIDEETDLIPIYEFYHKPTAALPNGRYILYASEKAIMYDEALPYRFLPIFRIAPANIIGTPYGYTPMFDLLPLQETINMLYSTIITNQDAFGVQNILLPKGAGISVSQLAGGLNVIEYTPGMGKPEPLNLTHTPAEIFNMIDRVQRDMETISGINNVARGNPDPSLQSGAALAMIQAQAINFASGLQGSYIRLIENVCSSTIKLLQDFASAPRIAAIAGRDNRAYMKEFSGADLSMVNRVIVEVSNPVSRTTAGRLEIATQLLQMDKIKNTDQYFTVLNTGRLDSMIEGDQAELLLIRAENERMLEGKLVKAMGLDSHVMHILEHKALMADPDLRSDANLVALVGDHILEHIEQLRTVDPDILQAIGQQPLQSIPEQGGAPEEMSAYEKPSGEERQVKEVPPGEVMQAPSPQATPAELPSMPVPPPPFQNSPTGIGGVNG